MNASPSPATVACPQCGTALPTDAPEGLCPRCLLRLNLAGLEIEGAARGEAAPSPAELAPHFPQLEILECLGRGGMGVVYKARQPRLNRLVALKVLPPGREQDPQFAERFAREAQALARLAHPAIVAVHDFGEANGQFYLLMEYVDGVSLRSLLCDGKLRPEDALAIVPKICEALQFAHERGVVHRDIKPENILLDGDGRVKIADFGIAKLLGNSASTESLTGERGVVGTPHYMAPEQIERPQSVDHRADIYSLGVVFYELLTGELPLGRFAAPSRKAAVDGRLDAVILRSLEKEPDRRYQQAGEVRTEVESIAASPGRSRVAGSPAQTPVGGGEVAPNDVTLPADSGSEPTAAFDSNRRQLRAVAIGLLLVVVLEWMAFGLIAAGAVVLVGLDRHGVDLDGPLPELAAWLQQPGALSWGLGLGLFGVIAASGVLALGALRLRRFESYRLALVAGALAMVLPPANLIGLPIGLWALIVLGRRLSQRAFRETLPSMLRTGTRVRRTAVAFAGLVVLPWLVLAGLRAWMVSPSSRVDRREAAIREQERARAAVADAFQAAQARHTMSVAVDLGEPIDLSTAPPVVVETVPASGSVDVASGESEVRVTFSKPMQDGGWSLSAWMSEVMPLAEEGPRYLADERTCILPVRLEAGRTYGFWLNNDKTRGFQDRGGRPAVPYLLVFRTRDATAP